MYSISIRRAVSLINVYEWIKILAKSQDINRPIQIFSEKDYCFIQVLFQQISTSTSNVCDTFETSNWLGNLFLIDV